MDLFSPPTYLGLAVLVISAVISLVHYFKRRLTQPHPFENQNIRIVNTVLECQDATLNLVHNCTNARVVGLDCEWVGKNKIALLQLATTDGLCVLIRLCKLDHIPSELKTLLEDDSILKVGIATLEDARLLHNGYGVSVRGCLDLRYLSGDAGGLAALSLSVLGVELDKSRHVRCSDWEAEELDVRQAEYAARDALSAVKIFHRLSHRIVPTVTRLKCSFVDPNWTEILKECAPFLDRKYHKVKMNNSTAGKSSKDSRKRLSEPRYETPKKPHYDNCWIVAPDGGRLSTCCLSKTRWYVRKGLGEVISDDPVTVRLFFEPSSRSADEKWLYVNEIKINQCVVCGTKESLIRKHVVPSEYKRYFPMAMKKHEMHDILLLCVHCHQLSNINDVTMRRQLEEGLQQDHSTLDNVTKRTLKKEIRYVRGVAKTLLMYRERLRPERLDMLYDIIRQHCNVADVTDEMLEDITKLEEFDDNPEYQPHGFRVVEKFKAGPGLMQLKVIWREHFVLTMRPCFLPALWSVMHDFPSGETVVMRERQTKYLTKLDNYKSIL